MKQLVVDMSARTMSGWIVLSAPEARKSIKEAGGVTENEEVLLIEGTMSVKAKIIERSGWLFANPDWQTMKFGGSK